MQRFLVFSCCDFHPFSKWLTIKQRLIQIFKDMIYRISKYFYKPAISGDIDTYLFNRSVSVSSKWDLPVLGL